MIYFVLGTALFFLITIILFCILHCSTPYDHMIDDEQQELFLRQKGSKPISK